MKNFEKYKTAEERVDAFNKWCHSQECAKCPIQSKCRETNDGSFYWLELEAEVEKPLPCPFCGKEVVSITTGYDAHKLVCECGYCSPTFRGPDHYASSIAAHNRIVKLSTCQKNEQKVSKCC